jgi:polar amino acid transport system substrate-binding protein
MKIATRATAIALVAVFVGACTAGASPSTEPTSAPTAAPSESAAATPAPTPDACAKENLATVASGKLTIGTDNPAYPPYFAIREGGNSPPWEDLGYTGDPTTGEGFESAAAYAIAKQLGFSKDEVAWVVVPFANSYAPGPKSFDFDINQVSYTPERAEQVDLSDGYYIVKQSVVALADSPLAKVTTIAGLKDFKLGAQVGTTSYNMIVNVIQPPEAKAPSVYDTNDAAIEALKAGQIDGIVVDLPTADFVTNVQVEGSTAVGKFEQGEPEYFSLVLAKESPLTACVNQAIKALTDDGTLASLAKQWLPFQDSVPAFQP